MRSIFKYSIIVIIILIYNPIFSAVNSQSLFEQGINAFNSRNYGSSELLFRKIIDNGDDEFRDRAWYYLALSIFHQKKYKSAIFEFNRLLLICTSSDIYSDSRYWIAESNFFMKRYIKSIEEFKRFIATSKNRSMIFSAHIRVGEIYFIQSRYDEAIIEWKKAKNKNGDEHKDSLLSLKIGEAYFLNANYDEMLKLLEPIILSQKDSRITAGARLFVGRVYQIKKKHRRALKAFRGVPDFLYREAPYCDVQYFKAISLLSLGDISSARYKLESFILLGMNSPWYYEARYELGRILIKLGKEKRGIGLLEEVRSSTNKMELRSKSALVLSKIFLKKDPKDAIPYLEDSVSLNDPAEQKNVLLLLGSAYIEVKRFEDAKRILELIMDKYPYEDDIDEVQFLLSRVYLERGNINRAIEGFEKVKELNPFSKYINESFYFLAVANYKSRKEQVALEYIKRYLRFKKSENKYDAYILLLDIHLSRNDTGESERIIKILINRYSFKKDVAEIMYRYAMSTMDKGKGEKYLNIIVRKYPNSDSAGRVYLLWGDIAFKKRDYKRSELHYRRYLQTRGRENAGSVFLYRIISLYMMEKYKGIILLLSADELPEIDKYTDRQLLLWKGRSYYRIGNYEKAYETLLNWELKDLSLNDILIVSRSSIQLGDLKTAESSTELLQKNKDLYAELLFYIGQYYLQNNDYKKSRSYFSSILFECPESEYVDLAKTSMAELDIKSGKYMDAIRKLNEIKNKKLEDKINALLIMTHFKRGEYKIAIELTKKNQKILSGSPYGEMVFRENLNYYYKEKDIKNFKKYSNYLKKYKGNENLINYFTGLIYFNMNKYNSSYYFLYRTAQIEGKYRYEALYLLALISYFKHKNTRLAKNYFNKLIKPGNFKNRYALKAIVDISIILNESGKIELSKKYLSEMIKGTDNKLLFIQAKNLYEYFGYSD